MGNSENNYCPRIHIRDITIIDILLLGDKIHGETINLVVMQFNFMLCEHDVLLAKQRQMITMHNIMYCQLLGHEYSI